MYYGKANFWRATCGCTVWVAVRVSKSSPPYPGRNADLRPGTENSRRGNRAIRPAHSAYRGGRGQSKAAERRLCLGQYHTDTNPGAAAQTGLGSRDARKRPAGASIQPDASRQATV